jgi:hypothetical protein
MNDSALRKYKKLKAKHSIQNLALEACIECKKRYEDKHLKAYFGVLAEPLDRETRRFYVITVVHYKHWTGPV